MTIGIDDPAWRNLEWVNYASLDSIRQVHISYLSVWNDKCGNLLWNILVLYFYDIDEVWSEENIEKKNRMVAEMKADK